MPGGAAAWLILTQQQRGGAEVAEQHVCFTYAGTAGTASYAGVAGWSYAGTLSPAATYAGEC